MLQMNLQPNVGYFSFEWLNDSFKNKCGSFELIWPIVQTMYLATLRSQPNIARIAGDIVNERPQSRLAWEFRWVSERRKILQIDGKYHQNSFLKNSGSYWVVISTVWMTSAAAFLESLLPVVVAKIPTADRPGLKNAVNIGQGNNILKVVHPNGKKGNIYLHVRNNSLSICIGLFAFGVVDSTVLDDFSWSTLGIPAIHCKEKAPNKAIKTPSLPWHQRSPFSSERVSLFSCFNVSKNFKKV